MIHDEKTTEIELPSAITAKKDNVVRVHFPPPKLAADTASVKRTGWIRSLYARSPWLFRVTLLAALVALSFLIL